jgi:FkbM family methyltransferase
MIRNIVKKLIIFFYGKDKKERTILRGVCKGYKINASIIDSFSIIFGKNEEHLRSIIKKYVKENESVIEIGSNIGSFTMAFSKTVGPKGRVFAFEAIPETAQNLSLNLKINNIQNVTLFNKAASDKAELLTFRIPDHGKNHSMASSQWHKNDDSVQIINVEAVAIDDVDEISMYKPSFVKIDVEGGEAFVLRGMSKLIKECRPVIFVECSELGRQYAWEFLISQKYKCFNAITNKEINHFDQYSHDDFLWLP